MYMYVCMPLFIIGINFILNVGWGGMLRVGKAQFLSCSEHEALRMHHVILINAISLIPINVLRFLQLLSQVPGGALMALQH